MSRNLRIIFERILCPTDLTEESDDALRYAIALARQYKAKLFVLNCAVAEAPGQFRDHSVIRSHIERSVLSRFPEIPACDWEAVVVEEDPVTAIPAEAAGRSADLIVMRSRRRSHAAALLGSTAEAICRTAPCPVLVTHPEERMWVGASAGQTSLRKVLVAHDFSDCSELALINALSLAQEYQAELHLLHILQSSAPRRGLDVEPSPEGAFQLAAQRLENSVPLEARPWCTFKAAVREGQPYLEILTYGEEEEIDLICMGVRGTGFGMRALFGSNADRVLRQAPCPVLIARPLKPASASPSKSDGSNRGSVQGSAGV
jgi:nucleotide-binding universal stress UspA family protein